MCELVSASEVGKRADGGRKREGVYRGEEGGIYWIAAENCDRAGICLNRERCCSRKDAAAALAVIALFC